MTADAVRVEYRVWVSELRGRRGSQVTFAEDHLKMPLSTFKDLRAKLGLPWPIE
jgi:hypothetical protein